MWGCTLFFYYSKHWSHRFPHACGGVPFVLSSFRAVSSVFPTHVGVYLSTEPDRVGFEGFPHACGGVPKLVTKGDEMKPFSPRMWGCTYYQRLANERNRGFPHACGGVPPCEQSCGCRNKFSPRMWGCTLRIVKGQTIDYVFPTHVGVYLSLPITSSVRVSFPHACGGVPPMADTLVTPLNVFPTHVGVYRVMVVSVTAPNVFPTHVGVYRMCGKPQYIRLGFPHACGGVPYNHSKAEVEEMFSPRMWGCTMKALLWGYLKTVFPTHVGVYRVGRWKSARRIGFPHACGGVPVAFARKLSTFSFSPRMWGCTRFRHI